jgi:UDP-N-acetylmuramate--alanine ligase
MYKKNKHIHFVGISGIGMSGIAAILKQQGYLVSGCDIVEKSATLDYLRSLGCIIYHNHHDDHVCDADVLVYSSAVNNDNAEVQSALKKGIPVIPRAIMLAELMRMKYGVAVAGSHGKTTTTSMISHIFTEGGLDPTIVIGGVLKNISTHARLGRGSLLVAEADESDRSLLYLDPSIAVLTNVDAEHLDTYKDLDDVKQTFFDFLKRLPFYGKAFVCIDDKNIRSLPQIQHISTVKYGFSNDAHIRGEVVEIAATYSRFRVYESTRFPGIVQKLGEVTLNMPGEHNVLNALAAISVGLEIDLPFSVIKYALQGFKGVERRFEFKGTYNGAEIFDDYGHHPTEIEKTLLVAKKRAGRKLHVVFQPHRYTRTEKLWDEFVSTFANSRIDTLFMTSIYPASEQPISDITSEKLAADIRKKNPTITLHYYSTYDEIIQHSSNILEEGDLFITIGAGKANCVGNALIKKSFTQSTVF